MKRLLAVTVSSICFCILTKPVYGIAISYNDLWDVSQDNVVTDYSPMAHRFCLMLMCGFNSYPENMFGGWNGSFSPTETYFTQDTEAGAVHWVEWQTPSPITLRSFNLVAYHGYSDGQPDISKGGFRQFRLYWGDGSGNWTLLYELADTDPDGDLCYGGGPTYTAESFLELAVNVTPTTAQYWRAEFVQYGDTGLVCINELDGYDTFLAPNNLAPVADAGDDRTVELECSTGTAVTLDGSGSSDPDGDTLTYEWTWGGGSVSGINPTVVLPAGTTTITLVVNDGTADSAPDTVDITVQDTSPPVVEITMPQADVALQDGVALSANAFDAGGVAELCFYVRQPDGGNGIPISATCEGMPATVAGSPSEYERYFDTTALSDGYYVILAKAVDKSGNEGWSDVVPFAIGNWAVVELLPASQSNKAGRTMPVKFALRVAEAVDPAMPFVYNEELEIRIYNAAEPSAVLQTSVYGDGSRDYRVDSLGRLYVTNFKTPKEPGAYVVEVWRTGIDFLVGSFTFDMVK
jgi:PKD domain